MTDLSKTGVPRRGVLASAATGLAALGLVGRAAAAESPAPTPADPNAPIDLPVSPDPFPKGQSEPAALRGNVSADRVTLPPLHAASELNPPVPNRMPPVRRLGVAVVGLGQLALGEIIPGFGSAKAVRLAAVVSGERDKARTVAAQNGLPESAVYGYGEFNRLRDDSTVDIVYIVLPNSMHAEFTARAAVAGKHVLCEKPMATTIADAEHMIDACRSAGRKLMIAYRLQYEPTHRTLIRLARSGDAGPTRLISAVNVQNDADNGQWRQIRALAGGGSLPDVGLYCLNAARYVTGEEPVAITASVHSPANDRRFREIEDICRFTLLFPSGAMAECLSAYSLHTRRTLAVSTPTSTLSIDHAFAYEGLVLNTERKTGETMATETRRFPPNSQFAAEMDAFADAIATDRTPLTPGEEGLQDIKLMSAIYQAAGSGRTVRLPAVGGTDVTRGASLAG